MNPISAVHLPLSPDMIANIQAKTAETPAARSIPQADLDKLPGSISMQPAAPGARTGDPFSSFLGQMVQEVNAKQAAAGEAVSGLLSGQETSLHQAILAMEEASVSFQLMVEVRNKLLESYQELMRMQI
jgi:flagellar hook-basal body complex protein FliE